MPFIEENIDEENLDEEVKKYGDEILKAAPTCIKILKDRSSERFDPRIVKQLKVTGAFGFSSHIPRPFDLSFPICPARDEALALEKQVAFSTLKN